MDNFTPPPGLPEERAKAWVLRHQRRAQRLNRRLNFQIALWTGARVFIMALCAVAIVLGIKASREAADLLAEPLPVPSAPPTPPVLEVISLEADPASVQVRFAPEVPLEPELQEALWQACDQYAVPYEMALGVAEVESRFTLDADNGQCVGAMQINRANFSWLEAEGIDPTTYEGNFQAGVLMLGRHLDAYGDWHKALMAYNCGAGSAAKLWAQGYTSSRYSRAVMAAAENWKTILDQNNI